jgi:hypothetical protein
MYVWTYGLPFILLTSFILFCPNFSAGCFKQTDCAGKAWQNYPSCNGCGYYLTCAPNGVFLRKCPQNTKYDANIDACSFTTSTCRGP